MPLLAAAVVVLVLVVLLVCVIGAQSSNQWGFELNRAATGPSELEPAWLQQCTCRALLANFTRKREALQPVQLDLDEDLRLLFSHNNTLPVEKYVVDDTNKGKGTHYKFSKNSIDAMVASSRELLNGQPSKAPMSLIQQWFIQAVQSHLVQGSALAGGPKRAVVWGATSPWYETMLLAAGVDSVTTIEYNKLTFDHPNLTTLQPHEVGLPPGNDVEAGALKRKWPKFDLAVSTSSFDHDGLGRYGDPTDPFGDLKAMRIARCLLKPGGLMLFAIPVGPDVTVYNLHRRYSGVCVCVRMCLFVASHTFFPFNHKHTQPHTNTRKHTHPQTHRMQCPCASCCCYSTTCRYGEQRLPAMLRGWEVVDIVGWDVARLVLPEDFRRSYEPIFVLRRPIAGNQRETGAGSKPEATQAHAEL